MLDNFHLKLTACVGLWMDVLSLNLQAVSHSILYARMLRQVWIISR